MFSSFNKMRQDEKIKYETVDTVEIEDELNMGNGQDACEEHNEQVREEYRDESDNYEENGNCEENSNKQFITDLFKHYINKMFKINSELTHSEFIYKFSSKTLAASYVYIQSESIFNTLLAYTFGEEMFPVILVANGMSYVYENFF